MRLDSWPVRDNRRRKSCHAQTDLDFSRVSRCLSLTGLWLWRRHLEDTSVDFLEIREQEKPISLTIRYEANCFGSSRNRISGRCRLRWLGPTRCDNTAGTGRRMMPRFSMSGPAESFNVSSCQDGFIASHIHASRGRHIKRLEAGSMITSFERKVDQRPRDRAVRGK